MTLGEEELGCVIHPAMVAAIGWVESRHGSDRLDAFGHANPPIVRVPLDGGDGVDLIRDTVDTRAIRRAGVVVTGVAETVALVLDWAFDW